jgi:hypothetical protein
MSDSPPKLNYTVKVFLLSKDGSWDDFCFGKLSLEENVIAVIKENDSNYEGNIEMEKINKFKPEDENFLIKVK